MVPVIVNFCGINRIEGSFTFNNLQGVLGNPSSINSHDTYIKNKNLHLYTGYIKFLNIQWNYVPLNLYQKTGKHSLLAKRWREYFLYKICDL